MKRPATCREFVEDLTGHSTRRVPTTDSSTPLQELWYLVYKDEMGASHTVKGSTSAIRRSLKDGLLGDASNVRASRIKAGPFEALRGFPEFRDLVVTAAPLNVPSASNTRILSPSASNSNAPTTPQFRSTQPADPAAPHIALVASPQQGPSLEWVKWVFLILIAAASAVLAFHFIPVP
jgi:hypothetical protein